MKIKRIVAAVTALVLVGGAYNATAAKNVISSVLAADTEASAEVVKDGIKYTISNGNAIVMGLADETITDLVVPDEVDGCPVTEINRFAFAIERYSANNIRLKSLTLGKNIEKIGANAFVDCKELETVTFNDELKCIDEYAFAGCCALTDVKFGSKLETIGNDAFSECFCLEKVVFGENVSKIGIDAFERTSIDFLEVPEKVTELKGVFEVDSVANCGIVIKNPECRLDIKYDWGDIIVVCDENSLARRDAKKYGLTCIDFEQYKNGEYEKKEQSPYSSLSVAGKYGMIFEEVEGGLKVKAINFIKGGTITVPDEVAGVPVVEFGSFEFDDHVLVSSDVHHYTKKVVLGKNVKKLDENSFKEFLNLEYIEGGEGLEEIGKGAFDNLAYLKGISFLKNIKNMKFSIDDKITCELAYGMAFYKVDDGLVVIQANADEEGLIVVPDEACGLPVVGIGDEIRDVRNSLVYGKRMTRDLKKLVIGKNVKYIGRYAFDACTSLETIEGGENLELIGDFAFACCDSLVSVKIPDNVRKIGENTFLHCNNLRKVEFNDKLEEIGESAFEVTDMSTVIIPEKVKKVGPWAISWYESATMDNAVVKILSPDCEFDTKNKYLSDAAKVYGYAGSTVAKYASEQKLKNFYAFGDANCDSEVDMSDVVLVMQSLANPNKYGLNGTDEHHITEKGIDCADVEGNGNGITASDALKIQMYLLGQEKFS